MLDDDYTEALVPSDSEDDEDELMDEDELELDSDASDDEDEDEGEMYDGTGEEVILTNDDAPSSDDEEMSEEEPAPAPVPSRRQAKLAAKAKPSKKVAFPTSLEAPRSKPAENGAPEPVGILKKTAKKAAPAKAAPKPKAKVAAPAKAAPVKAKAAERAEEGEKPYDFGAHFF